METIAAGAERAAPAGLLGSGGGAATPSPLQRVRRSRWTVLGALLAAAAAVAAALLTAAPPGPVASGTVSVLSHVRWEFLPVLVLLSVLHFVCSAVALRAAAGWPIPLYETTLAQFTAAAANRVTPGGLGAVAVNTRYLVCRGLPLSRAVVTVAVVQVAGVPADLLLMGAVVAFGGADGRVLDAMGRHAAQAAGLVPPVPLLIAGGVLLPMAALWGRRAARSAVVGRAVAGFTDLCRRPRDLGVTLAGSAATTFVLGLAFALSVLAVPGTGAGPADVLVLVAAYLVGAAAGAAIPSPGGVGSTEAALVAALASLGIAAGPALHAVLLFRGVTFWAPVPVGLLTCRTLRR
ncbi:flippase-like domain-containing protein [Spirillospora sp. NBC_00431]